MQHCKSVVSRAKDTPLKAAAGLIARLALDLSYLVLYNYLFDFEIGANTRKRSPRLTISPKISEMFIQQNLTINMYLDMLEITINLLITDIEGLILMSSILYPNIIEL